MASQSEYTRQLQALLPPGRAWPREPTAQLTPLLGAWADEMARLDARALQLLEEADPRTALELLGDWERVLGLPDECTAAATTIPARQIAAYQKLAALGGQTPAFYVALAASIGYTVEILEFDPGVDAGDFDTSGGRWRYVFTVHVLDIVDYSVFRAGRSGAGDRLIEGGALDLECVINRVKPAHTLALFTYPE